MPTVAHSGSRARASTPDTPRWSDHQLALFIELADAAGWHRHRAGLPENDLDGLTFGQRCRRRLAAVRTWDAEAGRHAIWAGLDDEDQADLDQLRPLPIPLRHLRRRDVRGGAA